MAKTFNAELVEQVRERKFLETIIGEQNRLKRTYRKLNDVISNVGADDRNAMLEFLSITADSLRAFETLPQEVRESLADGLEKMRGRLVEAKGFLPRGRGQRSEKEVSSKHQAGFATALQIELMRRTEKITLETARAIFSEKYEMTDSVVHKYWKAHHKSAKEILDITQGKTGSFATTTSAAPLRGLPRKSK